MKSQSFKRHGCIVHLGPVSVKAGIEYQLSYVHGGRFRGRLSTRFVARPLYGFDAILTRPLLPVGLRHPERICSGFLTLEANCRAVSQAPTAYTQPPSRPRMLPVQRGAELGQAAVAHRHSHVAQETGRAGAPDGRISEQLAEFGLAQGGQAPLDWVEMTHASPPMPQQNQPAIVQGFLSRPQRSLVGLILGFVSRWCSGNGWWWVLGIE